jgi:hypothetical protein
MLKVEDREFNFDIGAKTDVYIADEIAVSDFDIQYEILEKEGMKSILEKDNNSIPEIDLSRKCDISDFDFISLI